MIKHHPCRECGTSHQKRSFCSSKCRKNFNNRRLTRGAQLYDFVMANRYEREKGKEMGLMTIISRLTEQFHDEDTSQRDARHSWHDPAEILKTRPDLMVVRLGRMKIGRM